MLHRRTPGGVKRGLDVMGAGLALLALIPVFVVICVLIQCEDGGPVLFWQRRVGKHGRPFAFPKFRSMVVNAEAKLAQIRAQNQHGDTITFKMKDDPRITRVGKVLRRLSLDEAPQLWCVLTGEMSLVGPRPALPSEVAKYTLEARRRLDVTPGLTCIWQVSGRSNLSFSVQCRLDVEYIEQQSLALDLKLIAKTVPAVLSGKGAY
jgi:lipopolysaccharide/colanic/teichoic acid biosynthesis glycosyltransferase